MMHYVFDLDGTLVDSKDAVRQAYLTVGVTPPDDFFTKPWHSWLTQPGAGELHFKKNVVYSQLIAQGFVKPLPLMKMFLEICEVNPSCVTVMTGASFHAGSDILEHFCCNIREHPNIMCELTIDRKIALLNERARWEDIGIIFDDNKEHAERMKRETQWIVCHTL